MFHQSVLSSICDDVMPMPHAGGAEDQARMDLLRRCCSVYEGNHPFHNYTKRRLYRTPAPEPPQGQLCCQSGHMQAPGFCIWSDIGCCPSVLCNLLCAMVLSLLLMHRN